MGTLEGVGGKRLWGAHFRVEHSGGQSVKHSGRGAVLSYELLILLFVHCVVVHEMFINRLLIAYMALTKT